MSTEIDTVTVWSYGLAGIGYTVLALRFGFGRGVGVLSRALIVAVAASALWGLLGFAWAITHHPILLDANGLADVVRAGGWFGLLWLISRPHGARETLRFDLVALAAISIVAGGVAIQGVVAAEFDAIRNPGWLVLLHSLVAAVFGLVLVEQLLRSVHPDSRWNIKPLCLGLALVFLFDIYLYADALMFSRIDTNALKMRGFVHAMVMPLIAITAARSGNWLTGLALSRSVAFHSLGFVVCGVSVSFVVAASYYVRVLGGTVGYALQVGFLFPGLLVLGTLALSGAMRAKLKVLVSKHFFKHRYDYREEWLRFTRALSTCDKQSVIGEQVIRGLAQMVESPSGGLWLRDPEGGQYGQYARWNMAAVDAVGCEDGPLLRFLTESGWVINLEEYRSFPGRYAKLELPSWLSGMPNAWLVVPLAGGGGLIGFVVLATARTPIDVNWEVNDLLKTAGRQAASVLGQMQATEALLEARKFDAFSRMSAFVVHDLKNVVARLSLMMDNAARHREDPVFEEEMRLTAAGAVESMKQLMRQLHDGAIPPSSLRGVDLAQVIHRVMDMNAGQQPVPEVQVEEGLIARGHDARVARVIGHIVQNAIEATDAGGRVWIKLQRSGGQAMLEVGDTGQGMSADFIRSRLFRPFQTTKPVGMGIGAYESYQYMQELGGRILVDSSPHDGTRVRVLLPLLEDSCVVPGAIPQKEVA